MDITLYGTEINILAVLVASIIPMIIGALWYAPFLFGKVWMTAMGKKPEELGSPAGSMVISYVLFMILSFSLAWFLGATEADTLLGALRVALALWGGFMVVSAGVAAAFEQRKPTLIVLNLGYYLVSIIPMAWLLWVWT